MVTAFTGVLAALFVVCLIAYVWLQFATLLYERQYLLLVGLLFGQGIFGILLGSLSIGGTGTLPGGVAIAVSVWAVIAMILAIVKVVFLPDLRVFRPKQVTRQRAEVGLDAKTVKVLAPDGVQIVGYHLQHGHSRALVLCHGGGRCKNSIETVCLAQWLSYYFDIVAFDARGHFESGGNWTADGKTKLDLAAILDYVGNCGYSKIGVIGRSLGGWTAILLAAERQAFDSLMVVSAPLTHIRQTPMVRELNRLKGWPGRIVVRALQGLRYCDYDEGATPTPKEVLGSLSIPTFLVYSKQDDVVGVSEAEARSAYDKLAGMKRLHIFPEVAHLPYPWHLGPIYSLALEWFNDTLGPELSGSALLGDQTC